jgi:hypothetical protein
VTYRTLGFPNHNTVGVYQQGNDERFYCGGCNGAFELGLSSTAVSTTRGVFGLAFNIVTNTGFSPYRLDVLYGDDSAESFELPVFGGTGGVTKLFWAITSGSGIRSVRAVSVDGSLVTSAGFAIDDLTVAASPVPLPASLWLLLSALGALAMRVRRDAARRSSHAVSGAPTPGPR